MKQDKLIKNSGPYEVHSISQDMHGVRLEIYPAFPQYNISTKRQSEKDTAPYWKVDNRWPIHRYAGNGGGPGIFTAIALANAFEEFLNQSYTQEQVKEWKTTNAEALKKVRAKTQKAFEKAMEKQCLQT